MIRQFLAMLSICALFAARAQADFSYEQTTKMTGGALADMIKMGGVFTKGAREPQKSTVLVKDHKIAHLTKDRMSIVDVDAETITEVNFEKKTYSVMTFDEMKKLFAEMQRRYNGQAAKPQMDVQVDVKDTGEKKSINGLDTREMLMTMNMESTDPQTGKAATVAVITDSWIAAEIPGYADVRALHRLMAERIGWTPGMNPMGQGGFSAGMVRMTREVAKLDGMPVLQVTRVKLAGDPGAATTGSGGAPQATAPSPTEDATQAASNAAQQEAIAQASRAGGAAGRIGGAALGGMLGGLGKKSKSAPSQTSQGQAPAQSAPGVLMEMTTEMTSFSSAAIDASRLQVPAGLQKVDNEAAKWMRDQK
jgi:hypothetical protein